MPRAPLDRQRTRIIGRAAQLDIDQLGPDPHILDELGVGVFLFFFRGYFRTAFGTRDLREIMNDLTHIGRTRGEVETVPRTEGEYETLTPLHQRLRAHRQHHIVGGEQGGKWCVHLVQGTLRLGAKIHQRLQRLRIARDRRIAIGKVRHVDARGVIHAQRAAHQAVPARRRVLQAEALQQSGDLRIIGYRVHSPV